MATTDAARFDLDKAVALWRRRYEHDRSFLPEDVRELERHVRDHMQALVEQGHTEEAAFLCVMQEMGEHEEVRAAYRDVRWGKHKREHTLAHYLLSEIAMLKNYLKIAVRSLLRHRGYAFINVAGLALGMACCLLLFQYVAYETSYDQFNTKKDRLYRATFEMSQNGEEQGYQITVGAIFGPTMADEVPGIARYARTHPNYSDAVLSYEDAGESRAFTEDGVIFVDSTFLSMFDYPLVAGDPAQALKRPQTMLLSERTARKYFGDEEAVGKALRFTGWVQGNYTVVGVFEDVPATSHLQFDVLLPMEDLLADGRFMQGGSPWGWQNFITYFELDGGADAAEVEAKLTETYMRYRGDEFAASNRTATAYLQPLLDIHLNGDVGDGAGADRETVYFFTVIGLITLLIALVNYVNLATARVMDRAKEVGVRKVVGARHGQLVGQFLMESALTNGVALVLAIGLSLALLPVVNRVAEVEMTHALWRDGRFWAVFIGVFGVGALLSGLYPAFVLSSFKPVSVLKGKAGALASRVALRKVLVVVQFAASIVLLSGTAIVYAQLDHMRSLDTGLDLDQVLVVEGPRVRAEGGDRGAEMATLKNELRTLPAIQEIGLSGTTPGRGYYFYTSLYRTSADPAASSAIRGTAIDADFAAVYGLELVAGQAFLPNTTRPDSGAQPVIVNESLIRTLGFASNEEAIGGTLTSDGTPAYAIRGVFKDFRWSSAHQETEPVLFFFDDRGGNLSMIVSGGGDLTETVAAVEERYRALFPGNPFNYYFADAAFDEQYRADRRFATLFGAFAGIAIVIACLGLFGLASFTAAQRTKEIGVRKVLGASVGSIVGLLSRDFVLLVGIAFMIAAPVAFVYMKGWLADFAYHIDLGPGVFLGAGGLALLIALLTVSYQAIRAALADPVKSLRYE